MQNTIETMERNGFKERLTIKSFKTSEDMYKFLSGSSNGRNQWSESTKGLKAGTYAFCGGAWHNVKSLPSSVLAHV